LRERLARLTGELRRRKVFRAAGAYMVMAFITMQAVEATFEYVPILPQRAGTLVLVILIIGFPIAMGLAWALEWTPAGLRKELPSSDVSQLGAMPVNAPRCRSRT
jgi:adenylate cyclase